MEASQIAILLLVLGLALLAAEIFIPSGGMITIMAVLCLGGSMWYAWNAWWVSSRTIWWIYVVALIVLLPTTVGVAVNILPRTAIGRKFLLEPPTLEEVTPYAAEQKRLEAMLGHFGKTATLMNPGGIVLIDGERVHCETEGMLLERGETVQVVAVKGNRLVVRFASQEELLADRERRSDDTGEQPPLDFDLPQS